VKEDAMKFEEMDATAPLAKQLQDPYGGSVVLINKFTVALEDRDALVAAWANDAAYFKQQPGFISAQLHRGIGESPVFLNYAVWESVEAFKAAFGRPEFRRRLAQYPDSVVASPHLFEKVAVRTASQWPWSLTSIRPVPACQTPAVRSELAVKMYCPSGENSASLTRSSWPVKVTSV
jgi:heme-degrading monooxygenase HmoA